MCRHGSGIRERRTGSVSKLPQILQHCAENPLYLWLGVVVVHLLPRRHAYSAHTPTDFSGTQSCIALYIAAQYDTCPGLAAVLQQSQAKGCVPGTGIQQHVMLAVPAKSHPLQGLYIAGNGCMGKEGLCQPEVGRKVLIVVIGRQVHGNLLVYEQRRFCSPAARYILLRVTSTCAAQHSSHPCPGSRVKNCHLQKPAMRQTLAQMLDRDTWHTLSPRHCKRCRKTDQTQPGVMGLGSDTAPPVTSMGTLKAFMNSTALRWPSRDRLKQPRRSLARESAPAPGRHLFSDAVHP